MGFKEFYKEQTGNEISEQMKIIADTDGNINPNPNIENPTEEDDFDFGEETFTKDDLLLFLDELSDDDADNISNYILSKLVYDIDSDKEEDEDEDEEITETLYFDKTKQLVRQQKHKDIADRKIRARELKKYYKRNKIKIMKKAKKYRKRVKRNPLKVVRHRGN